MYAAPLNPQANILCGFYFMANYIKHSAKFNIRTNPRKYVPKRQIYKNNYKSSSIYLG